MNPKEIGFLQFQKSLMSHFELASPAKTMDDNIRQAFINAFTSSADVTTVNTATLKEIANLLGYKKSDFID